VALGTQFKWAAAAQFDSLLSSERFELGLPAESNVRRQPGHASKCDEAAAAPYDPDRIAPGVMAQQIVAEIAVTACSDAIERSDNTARSLYQRGRALAASGKFGPARRDFEAAGAAGYRASRAELAMLVSDPRAGMLDVALAVSLLGQAWHDGVTIAAFRLGNLYEHGVDAPGGKDALLPADEARAWVWYRKGADAGEPNSLARIAGKNDAQNLQLEAFTYYAAAAERARSESWPDMAWRDWRFRRASLARLLERQGMMQSVADEYGKVQARVSK
jgi:TPR repeat protein